MDNLDRFSMETLESISILVKAGRYQQALIVLYSAIDTLAWCSLPTGDVKGVDFCRWVKEYLHPEVRLGCTAEVLYGARCGLLHSSASESRMSRGGQVSELWYATSPATIAPLEAYAQKVGTNAKIIYFTAFASAFADGLLQYKD